MREQHLKCIRYGEATDRKCADTMNQVTFLSCFGYYIKDYLSLAVKYFSKVEVEREGWIQRVNENKF